MIGLGLLVSGAATILPALAFDWGQTLKQAMPEADKFTQITDHSRCKSKKLTQAIFPAYSNGKQIGVVFYAAPSGYGGNIHTLTVLDMQGTIMRVSVFSHNETPAYVGALNDGSYLRQFSGITLSDKLTFLIGARPAKRGDIQAITGATETSQPIAVAVSEARKLFVELYR